MGWGLVWGWCRPSGNLVAQEGTLRSAVPIVLPAAHVP
jgi:hypothetical protein